jgi:CubicO group peptidase (beta-lactamase class C family)
MTALPLDFQPGVAWAYSNTNYALLGYVVEKAAGVPYTQFVTDRILKPLGMTHTLFVNPYLIIPRRAHGFMIDQGHAIRAPYSGRGITSDGSLASTVADLAKWDQTLRERKLLSEEGYKLMWSRGRLNSGRTRGYGTGWFLNQPWEPDYVGHAGNSAGYSGGIARFTKANISVVVLCNLYPVNAEGMAKQIAAIYDPKITVQPPAALASDPNPARTAKITAAIAKLAAGTPDDTLLEPEVSAPMKTGRARMFPSPFRALAKIDRMAFAAEQREDSDEWLTYRVETPAQNFVLRVLWTSTDKLASAALSADGPKKPVK